MTHTILLASAICTGALWGTIQGMVMVKPRDARFLDPMDFRELGVRSHEWFRFYHRLILFFLASFAALVHWWPFTEFWFTIGALVLTWGAFEAAYSWARYAVLIPPQENVFGYGWYVRGSAVIWLHIARLLVGAIIVWRAL
ncbi:MAG TPA: hypothetical protein PLE60_14485 [Candidatus Latescibacteria bacterium]|nr:hypothetical protein [Candidatus Latescibacterota bacterium]